MKWIKSFNETKKSNKDKLFDFLNGEETEKATPIKLTKKQLDMKMLRSNAEKRQGTMEDMTVFRDAVLPKNGYNCFGEKLPEESPLDVLKKKKNS